MSPIQNQTYIVALVHVTLKMVVIIKYFMSECVESLDGSITVSTIRVTSNRPSRGAQVYSHR